MIMKCQGSHLYLHTACAHQLEHSGWGQDEIEKNNFLGRIHTRCTFQILERLLKMRDIVNSGKPESVEEVKKAKEKPKKRVKKGQESLRDEVR